MALTALTWNPKEVPLASPVTTREVAVEPVLIQELQVPVVPIRCLNSYRIIGELLLLGAVQLNVICPLPGVPVRLVIALGGAPIPAVMVATFEVPEAPMALIALTWNPKDVPLASPVTT